MKKYLVNSFRNFWEGPVTQAMLNQVSRKLLIELLKWNDRNGVYDDAASIREFGRVATREELEASFWNQYLNY